MKRKLSLLLVLLLAVSLVACKAPESIQETTMPEVTEEPLATGAPKTTDEPAAVTEVMKVAALKGPTGMGLAYLIQDHADQFQVEIFDAPDAITGKFISGEIDIAAVPINLASVLYNKLKGDVTMLAVNTLGVLYVVENGETIQSIHDLSGKTVYASGQGSTPEYILNYLLEKNNLTDSVTVEYVGEHAALAQMVASGEASIAVLPEPNVSSVLAKNENARIALDLTKEWDNVTETTLVQGCYIVRTSSFAENPNKYDAFLSACADSAKRVNSDPNAAALIAANGIVPSETIAAKAIPNCNIVCLTGEEMKGAALGMLQVLYNANPASVGGTLPADDMFGYGA